MSLWPHPPQVSIGSFWFSSDFLAFFCSFWGPPCPMAPSGSSLVRLCIIVWQQAASNVVCFSRPPRDGGVEEGWYTAVEDQTPSPIPLHLPVSQPSVHKLLLLSIERQALVIMSKLSYQYHNRDCIGKSLHVGLAGHCCPALPEGCERAVHYEITWSFSTRFGSA